MPVAVKRLRRPTVRHKCLHRFCDAVNLSRYRVFGRAISRLFQVGCNNATDDSRNEQVVLQFLTGPDAELQAPVGGLPLPLGNFIVREVVAVEDCEDLECVDRAGCAGARGAAVPPASRRGPPSSAWGTKSIGVALESTLRCSSRSRCMSLPSTSTNARDARRRVTWMLCTPPSSSMTLWTPGRSFANVEAPMLVNRQNRCGLNV